MSCTGVLAGEPAPGSGGIRRLIITASNGVAPAATQPFVLIVDQAPAFTSASRAVFRAGIRHRFTIRTTGYPAPSITEKGQLPEGLRFTVRQDGTATITGTPVRTTRGKTYLITLTARNNVGHPAVQWLSVKVR
jgi:large repetitive protein